MEKLLTFVDADDRVARVSGYNVVEDLRARLEKAEAERDALRSDLDRTNQIVLEVMEERDAAKTLCASAGDKQPLRDIVAALEGKGPLAHHSAHHLSCMLVRHALDVMAERDAARAAMRRLAERTAELGCPPDRHRGEPCPEDSVEIDCAYCWEWWALAGQGGNDGTGKDGAK